LAGLAGGIVKLEVNGRMVEVPYAAIRKANLVVEF
jgi:ribosome maturation factor RimP